MSKKLDLLEQNLRDAFVGVSVDLKRANDELTLTVPLATWSAIAATLAGDARFDFKACMDLCGVDYSEYHDRGDELGNGRFAVVYHLLSIGLNQRLRVRVFCTDDDFPVMPSMIEVWPGLNWFEREAFDLYGIVFDGHPDLRRILTDYGFVGHPFRKDFPLSGHVEMKYDPVQARVIYQPVSIDPREVTPRIVREENYGV